MRNAGIVTLSPTEISILHNTKGSLADEIVKGKRTQALVDAFSKANITHELEDGTSVTATIEEMIVMKGLMTEISRSRGFQSILDFQKVRGELVENKEQNLNVSLVDQDLAKRAIGK